MLSRLKTIVALMRNPRVSTFPKFLVIGAIAYILLPTDAVPDIAPVVGWIDDILFLMGALGMLFGSAPQRESPGAPSDARGPVIDVKVEPRDQERRP
jgi:uncharacterized membrane protein YkvA (DUF1232 family)